MGAKLRQSHDMIKHALYTTIRSHPHSSDFHLGSKVFPHHFVKVHGSLIVIHPVPDDVIPMLEKHREAEEH